MVDHPASLRSTCGQYIESSVYFGFLDRDYCYKSVAIRIPHDDVLAMIPYTGQKSFRNGDQASAASRSMSSKHRALNHTTTGPGHHMHIQICLPEFDPNISNFQHF